MPGGLVCGRKEETSVWCSVADSAIFDLLDVAGRILTTSLTETRALLAELEASEPDGSHVGRER